MEIGFQSNLVNQVTPFPYEQAPEEVPRIITLTNILGSFKKSLELLH